MAEDTHFLFWTSPKIFQVRHQLLISYQQLTVCFFCLVFFSMKIYDPTFFHPIYGWKTPTNCPAVGSKASSLWTSTARTTPAPCRCVSCAASSSRPAWRNMAPLTKATIFWAKKRSQKKWLTSMKTIGLLGKLETNHSGRCVGKKCGNYKKMIDDNVT